MKLSKLEIKGFKSFGEKVVFHFDDGITGIVGPNGCGKSNVVDAIRWVLGEQKTSALRSDKMENIIFNGTSTRKAQQFAEVSITFLNTKNILPTEYSEVTVTRRYYRSGDSEYLLNGVSCRLKDINNLFLDTGIGPDSYAIIELKMVESILSDKDGSRVELFQEAAGISKFKIRKRETLRKLDSTDKDLTRVDDLLFEIEKNMKSLEKQAKQAEKYNELKDEHKDVSVKFAHVKIREIHKSFGSLQAELDKENEKKTSFSSRQATLDAEVENIKKEHLQTEKVLASRQKALNEHIAQINSYEKEKAIKNQRLEHLKEKKDTFYNQIEQDKQSNERAEFSLKSLKEEEQKLTSSLQEYTSIVQELKEDYENQKLEVADLQQKTNSLSEQLRSKQENVFKYSKSLEINEVQLSTLKQELENNSSDTSERSANLKEFESKIGELKKVQAKSEKELAELKEKENHLNTSISSKEKEIEELREHSAKTSRTLDSKQNEFNLTKSFVDNLEGYPEAVKFLAKKSDVIKKAPLLSDLIGCEEKYRLSIENFLEPFMNYFVLENEAQALQAIEMLSNSGNGKANFFVLSLFKTYQPEPIQQFENCLKVTDLLNIDPKYSKLINFLLDNVYLVSKDQDALPKNEDVIFITQNGKVIKRKYSISGGSVGLFEGKRIGRVKNLEVLDKEIKEGNKKLDNLNKLLESAQSELAKFKQKSYKPQIEVLQKEVNAVGQELAGFVSKDEQLRNLINSTTARKETILDKIDTLSEEIEKYSPLLVKEKTSLAEVTEEHTQIKENLTVQSEILQQKSSVYNAKNIEFIQLQNKVNAIAQEIDFKQKSADSSKDRIAKNHEAINVLEKDIRFLMETPELTDTTIIELYEQKDRIAKGLQEVEKEYYHFRNEIVEKEDIIKGLRAEKEAINNMIIELNQQLNDQKVQIASYKERLKVEFNIELDNAELDEELLASLDLNELEDSLQKIKSKVEKIGPINPMALEAFNEVKERFDFYHGQKSDLNHAKNTLLETIAEIEGKAKEDYMKAFEIIRENFKNVFHSLFSEDDSCDLKLLNPDDPTESPIEIIAKPKGKKPLSISQLSGGEKTLTAISLLFAIYLLKPAPFCIFDEVDAPLDDSNIDKFNNIIRDFSTESQFIIVTHNKRTMSSTDIIYGVTMVEKGISTAVSVDLRELEEML